MPRRGLYRGFGDLVYCFANHLWVRSNSQGLCACLSDSTNLIVQSLNGTVSNFLAVRLFPSAAADLDPDQAE
jgi:hypothetical protein